MIQLSNFENIEDIDKAIESLSKVAERYRNVPTIRNVYQKKVDELIEYKKAHSEK